MQNYVAFARDTEFMFISLWVNTKDKKCLIDRQEYTWLNLYTLHKLADSIRSSIKNTSMTDFLQPMESQMVNCMMVPQHI